MLSTIALTPQGGFVMAQKRDNGTGTIYQRATYDEMLLFAVAKVFDGFEIQ